jgi:hypothetical protein
MLSSTLAARERVEAKFPKTARAVQSVREIASKVALVEFLTAIAAASAGRFIALSEIFWGPGGPPLTGRPLLSSGISKPLASRAFRVRVRWER